MWVALASPRIGRLLVSLGAARVLATGSGILAIGLAGLASAHGPVSYFAAWVVIGLGAHLRADGSANTAIVERVGLGSKLDHVDHVGLHRALLRHLLAGPDPSG